MGYFFADTPGKEIVNLSEDMLSNQQQFADGMGMSFEQIQTSLNDGFYGLNQNLSNIGSGLSNQMAHSTSHLSNTFTAVGEQLSQTVFQSAAMISGATFISALTSSAIIARSIKRQTETLKNELQELRTEQIISRRAITTAQMLTYYELSELKVQTIRNHKETIWAMMSQSEILSEIRELIKNPRQTEALELEKVGRVLLERGLYEQALQALIEAKGIIHDVEPGIAITMAFVYDNLKQFDNCKNRLYHAITLSKEPNLNSYCFALLSDLYWNNKEIEKATEYSGKALTLLPHDVPSRVNHAALLAEIGNTNQAKDIIESVLKEDIDNLKVIFDRKSFYRHELIPEILKLIKLFLDPELEEIKSKVIESQTQLETIKGEGIYKQTKGHKLRFDSELKSLEEIQKKEKDYTKRDWFEKLHEKYEELIMIEEDAKKATKTTLNSQRVADVRKDVELFLDGVYQRIVNIYNDQSKHTQLRLNIESIKSSLADNQYPGSLNAACELIINNIEKHVKRAEMYYIETEGKLFANRKRMKQGLALLQNISSIRMQVDSLRHEKAQLPFSICSECFSRWPYEYKHCGNCGMTLNKPFKDSK
jgi:tetratricopeptide (TPR) repeat protein